MIQTKSLMGFVNLFLQKYQEGLEESMGRGSNLIFNSVNLLYYHLQKISLKRGEPYIDSPEWLKNKNQQ